MVDDLNTPIILLIDDTPDSLDVTRNLLKSLYRVKVATSGVRGLKILEEEVVLPDLVLLDVMMPEMDGYQVCKIIKANPKTKDIPIIFLTSNEIRLSYDDFRIDSLSRELGSKLYNIDKKKYEIDFNNLDDVNKINKVKYQNFTNSYIKHPKSENISNWDIFIKYLQYKS